MCQSMLIRLDKWRLKISRNVDHNLKKQHFVESGFSYDYLRTKFCNIGSFSHLSCVCLIGSIQADM